MKCIWLSSSLDQLDIVHTRKMDRIFIPKIDESSNYTFTIYVKTDPYLIELVINDTRDEVDPYDYDKFKLDTIKDILLKIFKYSPELLTMEVLRKINQ